MLHPSGRDNHCCGLNVRDRTWALDCPAATGQMCFPGCSEDLLDLWRLQLQKHRHLGVQAAGEQECWSSKSLQWPDPSKGDCEEKDICQSRNWTLVGLVLHPLMAVLFVFPGHKTLVLELVLEWLAWENLPGAWKACAVGNFQPSVLQGAAIGAACWDHGITIRHRWLVREHSWSAPGPRSLCSLGKWAVLGLVWAMLWAEAAARSLALGTAASCS